MVLRIATILLAPFVHRSQEIALLKRLIFLFLMVDQDAPGTWQYDESSECGLVSIHEVGCY